MHILFLGSNHYIYFILINSRNSSNAKLHICLLAKKLSNVSTPRRQMRRARNIKTTNYMGVTTRWRRMRKASRFQVCKSMLPHLREPVTKRTFCSVWTEGNAGTERLFKRGHGLFFVAAFLDRKLRSFQSSCSTKTNTLYSDTVNHTLYNSFEIKTAKNVLLDMDGKIGMLKKCKRKRLIIRRTPFCLL